MINIVLNEKTEPLRYLILDLALYNQINNVTLEVGTEQTESDSIFVDTSECENLEEVMAKFALTIKDMVKKPAKQNPITQVWMDDKYGEEESKDIIGVLETAIEPDVFFALERMRL